MTCDGPFCARAVGERPAWALQGPTGVVARFCGAACMRSWLALLTWGLRARTDPALADDSEFAMTRSRRRRPAEPDR